MTTLKNPKNPLILCCENCDYNTCNKKDFNKHLKTKKHNNVVGTTGIVKKIPKIPKKNNYTCICSKTYIHNSSLWNHKKKCNNIKIEINEKENTDIDLVIKTLKLKITNLESDLQDSKDSWWRLKDQTNHYIKLYNQQKQINLI